MSVIDEIKARLDLVDIVSQTVQLRRSGKNYTGFCPFHENTRTPAFVVFSDTGTWRCFGQCNEGGDIFKYVMKKEGWDFPEALRYLAEKAGVQLRTPTQEEQAAEEEHTSLRGLLEEAAIFFHHNLVNTNAGKEALAYLREKRNLSMETIEAFGLGYAPNTRDACQQVLLAKGRSPADLAAVGLTSERESGEIFDRFRHRIMFPIRDERGRITGFGARILNPDDIPKFLNSPQTALFDKGHLLYGLDRARKPIRQEDQAVIVEGYLDVIALHQAGFTNVVSPMGTALSEHQLALLKRFTRRIVLALDPDAAGDKATLRGLEVARQAMDREQDPVFDARGLLGYERRLQADIRVTTLPQGMDPDEIVARNPQEWRRIVAEARPVVAHVMDTLVAGRDVNDPKVKDEIAGQVLPLIRDLPSPIERDTYTQRLARLLHVDEHALLETAARPPRRHYGRRRVTGQPAQPVPTRSEGAGFPNLASSSYALEAHCLGVLLRRPNLIFQVDRQLQNDGLARLTPEDFQHADHQSVLRILLESIDQDMVEPFNFTLYSLSLPLLDLADGLLARTEKLDPQDERVLEDLMRALVELRSRGEHQNIDYLRFLMQEAQEQGDIRATQYRETMVQHTLMLQRLNRARARYTNRLMITR